MRDDEQGTRARPCPLPHRAQDASFRLHIEIRRRLIEHEDRCVAQQRARDGDALSLAAAQAQALFTDARGVSIRPRGDERVNLRDLCRLRHLRVGCVWTREQQILANRPIEQVRRLRNDGEQPPHRFRLQRAQVLSIQANRTGRALPKAQQQIDERRLARPTFPNQRKHFASRQIETNVVERERFARRIAEGQVLDCNRRQASADG